MKHIDQFLSCDWGSTSFRLRWIRGIDCTVVREIRDQTGVKALYQEATNRGAYDERARAPIFADFLRAKLSALLADEVPPPTPLPLFISGMASSTVGWRELPYATVHFPLNGSGVVKEELHWNNPAWVGPTHLISGVATEHEMMRGEETEIIGLMAEPVLAAFRERSLVILPGTHSKHVWIENNSVIDWRTFMTGELFDVLGTQSLLRASVETKAAFNRSAFEEGVLWANERGLAEGLFRVRTRAVLGRRPLAENTSFFSGLLIGAELADINANEGNRPVILAAAGILGEFYGLALKTIASPSLRWMQLQSGQVERAVISAHALLCERL